MSFFQVRSFLFFDLAVKSVLGSSVIYYYNFLDHRCYDQNHALSCAYLSCNKITSFISGSVTHGRGFNAASKKQDNTFI